MLFTLMFLISLSNVFGQELSQDKDNEVYAKQITKQLELEDFSNFFKKAEFLMKKLPAMGKGCKDCNATVENVELIKNDNRNRILIFVSFSMPKVALVELNNQAQKYKARLILRGIYQNSFTKTKDKILEIEPNGLTFDIDPQLFKQYKVERVPTFILLKNGKEVNRLIGNVTLEFAYKKLSGEQK